MNPERRRHIKAIYQSAMERKLASSNLYFVEACGSDEELRREVESLLKSTIRPSVIGQPGLAVCVASANDLDAPPLVKDHGMELVGPPPIGWSVDDGRIIPRLPIVGHPGCKEAPGAVVQQETVT
jgi:hypothetical protein